MTLLYQLKVWDEQPEDSHNINPYLYFLFSFIHLAKSTMAGLPEIAGRFDPHEHLFVTVNN
jgi:hypothetical protein